MNGLNNSGLSESEQLLITCERLLQRHKNRFAANLHDVLSTIGNSLKASRISIFLKEDPGTVYEAYEWKNDGSFVSNGKSVVYKYMQLKDLSEPITYTELDDSTESQKSGSEELKQLRAENIKNFMEIPFEHNGKVMGCIGIANLPKEAADKYKGCLVSLSYVILGEMLREHDQRLIIEARLKEKTSNIANELAIERAKLFFWETDLATNSLTVIDTPYASTIMKSMAFPKSMKNPTNFMLSRTNEEGKAAFLETLQNVKTNGHDASCTLPFFKESGEEPHYLRITLYPCPNKDHTVTKLYGMAQDISDFIKIDQLAKSIEKQKMQISANEKELSKIRNREQELLKKHEAALGSLEFILWEIDLYAETMIPVESHYLETARKRFGMPEKKEDIYPYIYGLLSESNQKAIKRMFAQLRQGRKVQLDITLPGKNETLSRTLHFSATPTSSNIGDWDSAIATSLDVTERNIRNDEYHQEITYFHSARNKDAKMRARIDLTTNELVESIPDLQSKTHSMSYDNMVNFGAGMDGIMSDGREIRELLKRNNLFKYYAEGKRNLSLTVRRINSNQVQWLKTDIRLLENPDSHNIEFFCYISDITTSELWSRMIEKLGSVIYDFIAIINPKDSSICFIGNPHYPDLKYIDYNKYLQDQIDNLIAPEEIENFKKHYTLDYIVNKLDKNVSYSSFTTWKSGEDGNDRLRKMSQYTYLDTSKELIFRCVSDITEQYKREQKQIEEIQNALEKAASANRAKSEFVSRISHDIRTPIGAILNLTGFALEDTDQKDKLLNDLSKIKSSGHFLLSLINDVLDISKIDSGKIELMPEVCLYDSFVNEFRNLLEPMCNDKGLKFLIDAAPVEIKAFRADRIRVNQVTLNLLSNAVKYTPKGGSVTLRLAEEKISDDIVKLHICVSDNGIGMTDEFQRKMFDEFTQDDRNPYRDRTTPGTGLGLSIVHRMVVLMGGEITVHSRVGKGSSFLVSIPLEVADESEAKQNTSFETVASDKPLEATILLAEDNMINAEIAERIFGNMGVTVEHAENGAIAVQMFNDAAPGHYDAIFMDIQMPELDGYGACTQIRQLEHSDAKQIPIVAMTANAFADAVVKAGQVGMNEYTTKPLSPDKIKAILLKILSAKAART